MAIKGFRKLSDLPIPPGEVLAEELEARGMTQKELAARLGRPAQVVSEVVNAKKSITPDTAIGLEKVLGLRAEFWNGLESDYQMALARNREKEVLEAKFSYMADYPWSAMVKQGWIESGLNKPGRLNALLNFLGTATPEPQAFHEAVGFRITEAAQQKISLGALAVWLRKGELEAEAINTADYDAGAFQAALREIRGMTHQSPQDFVPEMTARCAASGVAFCIIPELPKVGANGVARWLTDRKAMIQMNIRNKWADIFWFTFFHEAGHILKHRAQRRMLVDGLGDDPETAELEMEADQFARDFLIAPEDWNEFCALGNFTANAVREFAKAAGVAPFIVAGRLQKQRLVAYNQLTGLKLRYQWVSERQS